MNAGFVYILTNKTQTTLYTGVTNSLLRRVVQHRNAAVPGFTARYNVDRLIYFESYNDIRDAIRREKQIKGWVRRRKLALIAAQNPGWADLAESVLGLGSGPDKVWREPGSWRPNLECAVPQMTMQNA